MLLFIIIWFLSFYFQKVTKVTLFNLFFIVTLSATFYYNTLFVILNEVKNLL